MKIDEIVDRARKLNSTEPSDTQRMVTAVLAAEDITRGERDAIISGYLMGLMYAFQVDREDVGTEMLMRVHELEWA